MIRGNREISQYRKYVIYDCIAIRFLLFARILAMYILLHLYALDFLMHCQQNLLQITYETDTRKLNIVTIGFTNLLCHIFIIQDLIIIVI